MRRTLPLFAVLASCVAGLAYGLPAATGAEYEITTPAVLDTSDRPAEPRAYAARAPQPATVPTVAPSSSTAPAATVSSAPVAGDGDTAVEAPASPAVTPQATPVAEVAPAPVVEPLDPSQPDYAPQLPEEVIGSYRCGDTTLVVVALGPDGELVCGEVQ